MTEPVPWPRDPGHVRRAGISAFGISGTNAHVIIEEAPADLDTEPVPAAGPAGPGGPVLWVLSGRTPAALRDQARRLHERFASPAAEAAAATEAEDRSGTDTGAGAGAEAGSTRVDAVGVGAGLALTRSHFAHRAAVVAEDPADLLDGVAALARGELPRTAVRGRAVREARTAFLFSGQGSQRPGMGRELAATHPVFANALDEAGAAVEAASGVPLRPMLFAEQGSVQAEHLDRTEHTQPALFAFQFALLRLLESWSLRPDVVTGHSVGAITAACAAGVLTLSDAAALVVARGRLMGALPPGGGMVAVEATEEEVLASLRAAPLGSALALAAVNGPRAVVVSGPSEALTGWAEQWSARGRRTRTLRVSHAFHSPLMEPVIGELDALAATLTHADPRIPLVSDTSGTLAGPRTLAAPGYWGRHADRPVRFHDAVRTLRAEGVTAFLEIGPAAVLTTMVQACLEDGAGLLAVPALTRDAPEPEALLSAVAELHLHGAAEDLSGLFTGVDPRRVRLPTYPFQQRRYWIDGPAPRPEPAAPDDRAARAPHPPAEQDPTGVRDTAASAPLDVLDTVLAQVAHVLGYDDETPVPADATLLELGVDSMGAVRLQRRLRDVTGLDLPATLLVEHPTPTALAARLGPLLEDAPPGGPSTEGSSPPGNRTADDDPGAGPTDDDPAPTTADPAATGRESSPGPYAALVRTAHERDELAQVLPLLQTAARYRSTTVGEPLPDPEPLLVCDGSSAPGVVCVPSFLAGSGPHQFARLATGFHQRPRVTALALPGFGDDPRTPASWAELVDALASAALRSVGEAPVLLVGHSVGGVIAHAVAAALERAGHPVAGSVLIDTYAPVPEERSAVFSWAMGSVLDRDPEGRAVSEAAVLAMGGYLGLLDAWSEEPLTAPSLLVTAERPPAAAVDPAGPAWTLWRGAGTTTSVPGDHFSLLEAHAHDTARAIEGWLRKELS
ncbi:alpha/beta fold hydrolase [Streptomyces sp. NPDC127068]|uniref:alpha/beta fold hydrolase n=1 Tax=Streptomyces sp. NPDC127068 TaxID=3347127 RepID=UPI003648FE64